MSHPPPHSPPRPPHGPPRRPARRTPAAPPTGIAIVLVAQLMLVLDATVVNVALPAHRRRPRLRPGLAVLGAQRLHARLRRPAAARRPPRRRLRPAAGSSRSAWRVFTLASLLGGLAQTPELAGRRPRRSRASAPPSPHPACSPCSPPAPPTRPPATAPSRSSAPSPRAARRIGLLLGGAVTDLGSWRWTLFINVPIGLAVLLADPAVRGRDPAPPGPLRRRRRAHRDPRRRLDRVGADRRARARLGLGPHRRRPRRSARCSWSCWRVTETPRRAPDDPARPAAQPPPPRRPGHHRPWSSAASCRCSSSSCSTSSACSASAR